MEKEREAARYEGKKSFQLVIGEMPFRKLKACAALDGLTITGFILATLEPAMDKKLGLNTVEPEPPVKMA